MWREVPSGPWNLGRTSGLRTRGRGWGRGRGRSCCRRPRRRKYQHSLLLSQKKKEKKKKRYIKIESYWISAVVSTVLSSSIIVTINIDRSFKVTSYSNNTNPLPSNDTICVIINYCLLKRTSNTSMRLFKQVTSDFVMQDISFMMWSTSKCFL